MRGRFRPQAAGDGRRGRSSALSSRRLLTQRLEAFAPPGAYSRLARGRSGARGMFGAPSPVCSSAPRTVTESQPTTSTDPDPDSRLAPRPCAARDRISCATRVPWYVTTVSLAWPRSPSPHRRVSSCSMFQRSRRRQVRLRRRQRPATLLSSCTYRPAPLVIDIDRYSLQDVFFLDLWGRGGATARCGTCGY